ncbi:ceramide synthase 4-like [Phascolarctos cinereus]|uniref:Ceramide synthase 4-like n=1 Tax=Phascolarctos cinereus TaxID=38626 RepID=A0A6P5JHX7_PHACI|nr:ceramide synthase 4-like [Phascolarctos cinereus]
MLVSLYDCFWNDRYWFPKEYSWADLEDSDGAIYPHPKDLLTVIPLTFVLITVRYIFERAVGLPLSRLVGVRDGRRIKASHNPILESFFQTQSQNPKEAQLSHLATQCSLSLREVQRWFRRRRNQKQPLLSMKFSETCWKFIFYFSSFFGGLLIVYSEPWLWKSELCWNGFPKQALKPAVYWWYLLEFSFYLSLVITLSFDVKRKDFKQQIIHHFSAIILIYFSYCANYIRIGTLVMLLHDVSDIFLEAGKMANYAQWKNSSTIIFVIFTVIFLISRLILFPYKILYTTYYSSMENHKPFFGYYFSNALLMILQALNVFWSFLILHVCYRFVIMGKTPEDVRSDIEEQCTSDEQSETGQKSKSPERSQTLATFPHPGVSGGLSPTKRHHRSVPAT